MNCDRISKLREFNVFMLLYHFLWTIVGILGFPIVPLLRKGRFSERLTLGLSSVPIEGANIWVHALSVGEVISALSLVDALRLKYPGKNIVFTVTTSTGMNVAQRELGGKVNALVTMPIDFWWCVHRIVNYIRPSIFILVETDIWPALINYLRKRGVKSILVNGRVSPRTSKAYNKFAFLARKLFEHFELCLMTSDLDTNRLLQVGIGLPEKVITVGNIKFDRDWEPMCQEERQKWLNLLSLESEDRIWVAGSTHPGEEKILMDVFKKLRPSFHALRLILAPRAIEQSDDILSEAQSMGLRAVLKTELSKNTGPYDVLILNSLGELGRVYGLSEVSFVGGSLEPSGGHNLLEPASFGCPVFFGPHTEDFDLMSQLLIEAGGGQRVRDGKELYDAMKMILTDPEMRIRMGRHAKEFVDENRGALGRVVSRIDGYMDGNGGFH
jgi:3-deoxy-D-manno-octulosonic-acid transferase